MTPEEWIDLIIAQLGGDTSDMLLATWLPVYWDARTGAPSDAARAAMVKIDGINLLLGNAWRNVDFKALDGSSVNLSDMFEHLTKLLDLAKAEAAALVGAESGTGGAVAIGSLTTTAPIMPDRAGGLDGNARRYRGDPLRRGG